MLDLIGLFDNGHQSPAFAVSFASTSREDKASSSKSFALSSTADSSQRNYPNKHYVRSFNVTVHCSKQTNPVGTQSRIPKSKRCGLRLVQATYRFPFTTSLSITVCRITNERVMPLFTEERFSRARSITERRKIITSQRNRSTARPDPEDFNFRLNFG